MTGSLAANTGAVLAIVRRDMQLYVSYRLFFISQLFQVFFVSTLFYYVSRLVAVDQFGSPDEYYAFVIGGLVIMQVLTAALATLPRAVRQELVAGTFERLLLSPLGPTAGILAMTIFPFLLALVVSGVTLAFAAIVFGLPLEAGTAPLGIPVILLGALAFVPFALVTTAVVVTVKQAMSAAGMVIALLSLVGGFFFPVALLPDWIEWTSEVQPFTPTLDLVRHLVVGVPLEDPAWLDVVKLAGFAAVLLPVGAWLLSRAVDGARSRGTILEY